MYVIAEFAVNGVPETSITPFLHIRDVASGSLTVATTTMSKIGDGFYRYNFDNVVKNKNYTIFMDGGSSLPNSERYKTQIVEVTKDRVVSEK